MVTYEKELREPDRRQDQWDPLSKFVHRVGGWSPPTGAMVAGRTLHRFLEWGGAPGSGGTTPPDPDGHITWRVSPSLLSPHLVEVRRTRDFELVDGRTVRLSGIIDAISGQTGIEYKGTGWIRWDTYIDSPQWRCYLALFPELAAMRYDVFRWQISAGNRIAITDHDSTLLRRYPTVDDDVLRMLHRWAELADRLIRDGRMIREPGGRLIDRDRDPSWQAGVTG